MTKKEERLIFETTAVIAHHYGCPTKMPKITDFSFFDGIPKKSKNKIKTVVDNNTEVCRVCGTVQLNGFLDPELLLIEDSTNNLYTWADVNSYFHCFACFYNYKNYAKKMQGKGNAGSTKVIGDIGNVIIYPSKREECDFLTSSTKNKLYEIFKKPIKAPYVVMLKKLAGLSAMVDMAHTSVPTIDSNIIIVNYGNDVFRCPRKKTLECIRDGDMLIQKFNNKEHKVSDDTPFNRQTSEGYNSYLTEKLRRNSAFMKEYSDFISKYDKGIRFVSKIMLETYREEQKQKNKKEGK